MKTETSSALLARAEQVIPGGVNSPVRAFRAVGGHPLFIQKAKGAHIHDVDGNRFIDYVGSWGPMILGHAHPDVVAAITRAAEHSSSFGAPTEGEVELAELLVSRVKSLDAVRLVNSGTEATMSALRLAGGSRGATPSSSSPVATTGTPITCSSKRVRAWPPWACPTLPGFPKRLPNTP